MRTVSIQRLHVISDFVVTKNIGSANAQGPRGNLNFDFKWKDLIWAKRSLVACKGTILPYMVSLSSSWERWSASFF